MKKDNFNIGIIGIIVVVAIIYFLGKTHGRTEMENEMYKQMYKIEVQSNTL